MHRMREGRGKLAGRSREDGQSLSFENCSLSIQVRQCEKDDYKPNRGTNVTDTNVFINGLSKLITCDLRPRIIYRKFCFQFPEVNFLLESLTVQEEVHLNWSMNC